MRILTLIVAGQHDDFDAIAEFDTGTVETLGVPTTVSPLKPKPSLVPRLL
jgi:hypothetical protein